MSLPSFTQEQLEDLFNLNSAPTASLMEMEDSENLRREAETEIESFAQDFGRYLTHQPAGLEEGSQIPELDDLNESAVRLASLLRRYSLAGGDPSVLFALFSLEVQAATLASLKPCQDLPPGW